MVKKNDKIKKLEKEIEELTNKWKRALADYQNLEKRVIAEKKDFLRFANASLITKLLPVLDGLENCYGYLKDKGLGLILDQFKKILESEGVKEIKVEGEKFDPEKMDVVEKLKGKGNRIELILKGYRLNDKVLRPAKVKIK